MPHDLNSGKSKTIACFIKIFQEKRKTQFETNNPGKMADMTDKRYLGADKGMQVPHKLETARQTKFMTVLQG